MRCASRRAYKEREHLSVKLREVLARDPKYQLWLITGTAEDSPEVRKSALAVVWGMKRLLRHPRLRGRVIEYFSVLEVERKQWRNYPCAHVHTLLITKPIDKGKYRISKSDWVAIWETVCPRARNRIPSIACEQMKNGGAEQPSLKACLIPRDENHLTAVIRYCTKWAAPKLARRGCQDLFSPHSEGFVERMIALKGVPRFFGDMHIRKARKARPWIAKIAKTALVVKRQAQEGRGVSNTHAATRDARE